MLSITDLMDFIDLDMETIRIVNSATQLPVAEATSLAKQLLATEHGISILHHMYRDRIAAAAGNLLAAEEMALRQAYKYFSRKYPIPRML